MKNVDVLTKSTSRYTKTESIDVYINTKLKQHQERLLLFYWYVTMDFNVS